MGWGMSLGIVTYDSKSKTYRKELDSRDFPSLKNLCNYRCMLNDLFVSTELSKEIFDEMNSYTAFEHMKTIKQDEINMDYLETFSDKDYYREGYVFKKDTPEDYINEIKEKPDADYYEVLKAKGEGYVTLYEEVKKSKGGRFYDASAFRKAAEFYQKELEKVILKQGRFERVQNSLQYQILTDKQKNNVLSEYEGLDEEYQDADYKLATCYKVLGLLEFYEGIDVEAYAYIYGD